MKRLIFFTTTFFLLSFAIAQSQMINGTVVPNKKKSVIILPIASKDSSKITQPKASSKPKLKPTVNGKSALTGLDTTIKTNPAIRPSIHTNLKAQYLKGTIIPDKTAILLKPIAADTSNKSTNTFLANNFKIITPLDVLDTSKIVSTSPDEINKYSLPPQHSNLRPQLISGALQAKPGIPISIVPTPINTVMDQEKNFPLFPPEIDSTKEINNETKANIFNPLDALDTSLMVYDPSTIITSYSLPPANRKHQDIIGIITAIKGKPIIIEPVSKDSSAEMKTEDSTSVNMKTDTETNNNTNIPPQEGTTINNDDVSDSIKIASNNTIESAVIINFYVSEMGKFTLRFSTDKFYIRISQLGKIIDFGILSNGKITSNVNRKIVQIGNVKLNYNVDGTVASIADTPIAYTFDGSINRVGKVNINYSNKGEMEKVGDLPIYYNSNKTVEKIATYRVGYDSKQMVIGIDDSNGLVVFKPVVK